MFVLSAASWNLIMKKSFLLIVSYILLGLLMPYLSVAVINGKDLVFQKREPNPEEYLPAVVAMQIPADYEPEAIKAQAVIARSNLLRRLSGKESMPEILAELYQILGEDLKFWEEPKEVYEEAVSGTLNQVLVSDGELKLVPYHELSAGATRDGESALKDPEYAYLVSVDSSTDKNSPDYTTSTYIQEDRLPSSFVVNERDEGGYVVSLTADGETLEGETFAEGLGLASSDFSIQRLDDKIRFVCRGKGHGLGFSQYGGNKLALEGKSWREILGTYFPKMEVVSCETW